MDHSELERLLAVLVRLRGPDGCAWDRSQDLASAASALSDEVFEYVDAARRESAGDAFDELSDLFFMVCFNWLLLHEQGAPAFEELSRRGADKLERRKPHVFTDDPHWRDRDPDDVWREVKATEQAERGEAPAAPSVLEDLPPATSPLRQAIGYGRDAARVGFDWESPQPVLEKLHEELEELAEARRNADDDAIEDETGDLLFACVQLARKLGVDPDAALRRTNAKFARRFRAIEAMYENDPDTLRAAGIEGQWQAWAQVKAAERAAQPSGDDDTSSGQPSSSSSPS